MNLFKLNYVEETRKNWHAGMISFICQRVTGVALVFYLLLHLFSLSSVLSGEQSFKDMMGSYNTPLFHVAEWLLLACVAFHALNGVRLMVADWFGVTRVQRGMFWLAATATIAMCLASIPFFFLWR